MLAFPALCDTDAKKLAYTYRAQEKLRLWHNVQGARTKLSPDKPLYLSLADFRRWVREQWEPRFKAVCYTRSLLANFDQAAASAPVEARRLARVAALADSVWDGQIDVEKFPRLGVAGEPPDPTENYTTYTEVDANARLSVDSATQITATGLLRSDESYIYKDMGAAHFAGDFTHLLDTKHTASGSTVSDAAFWATTNAVDDMYGLRAASAKYLYAYWYGNTPVIYLQEGAGATQYSDGSVNLVTNTQYYMKVVRNEAVGTYGTLYLYIYSDSGRTSLVDTLSVALHEKLDLRYVFAVSAYNDGNAASISFIVSNLDLGEQSVVPLIYWRRQQE